MRNLEREISKICRKVVKQLIEAPMKATIKVQPRELGDIWVYNDSAMAAEEKSNWSGTGLAWTEVGGELLTIEAAW